MEIGMKAYYLKHHCIAVLPVGTPPPPPPLACSAVQCGESHGLRYMVEKQLGASLTVTLVFCHAAVRSLISHVVDVVLQMHSVHTCLSRFMHSVKSCTKCGWTT